MKVERCRQTTSTQKKDQLIFIVRKESFNTELSKINTEKEPLKFLVLSSFYLRKVLTDNIEHKGMNSEQHNVLKGRTT